MDRLGLLGGDTSGDDQVLETDIMRFLAVIGIVFWIIFSVIKSIPFQAETTVSSAAIQSPAQKPRETIKPAPKRAAPEKPEPPEPPPEPALTSEKVVEPVPEPKPPVKKPTKPAPPEKVKEKPKPTKAEPMPKQAEKQAPKPEKTEKQAEKKAQAPSVKGVKLEFQSLDAIMRLVQDDRLRVYGRAKATGFDLIFLGQPAGNTVRFKNAREIPREMWEIKDGKARQYFIDRMARTFPSIRSFPDKRVQVAFLDKALEDRVLQKMERLRGNDKNGILSVTGQGELMFSGQ